MPNSDVPIERTSLDRSTAASVAMVKGDSSGSGGRDAYVDVGAAGGVERRGSGGRGTVSPRSVVRDRLGSVDVDMDRRRSPIVAKSEVEVESVMVNAVPSSRSARSSIDESGAAASAVNARQRSASANAPAPPPPVLHRPPIRPPIPSISKSKFELEPNPFEQSFSRSSNSIRTGGRSNSEEEDGDGMRGRNGGAERGDGAGNATVMTTTAAKLEPTSPSPPGSGGEKTALPPLSALTSPAPQEPHFSWSGLSSSLRAGPLSPAMLTGPAANSSSHQPHGASGLSHSTGLTPQLQAGVYDPSTFRTGFTPGSGFTPSFGGAYGGPSSFPMPSPNTAAFLSMVTNSTPQGPDAAAAAAAAAAGGGGAGAGAGGGVGSSTGPNAPSHLAPGQPSVVNPMDSTITPNTLNALTGVINSMNAANGAQQGYPGGGGGGGAGGGAGAGTQQQSYGQPSQHPPHPPHMGHSDSYFPQQHQQHGGGPGYRPVSPRSQGQPPHMAPSHLNGGGHLPPHMLQPMGGPQGHPMHHHPQHQQQPMSMPPSHLHGDGGPAGGATGYPQRAAVAANQAANGLFLLSQAHQELSKREEESKGEPTTARKGSKRKSEDAGQKTGPGRPATKRTKKNSVSAAAPSAPLPDAIPMAAINGKRSSMSSAASPDYMRSMDEDDADPDQKLLEMAGYDHQNNKRSSSQTPGKPETEEEKRKNFLERNRQAALKCRQRKKAWLSQLQTKVDGLTSDNDRLKNIIQNLTDEVARMSAVLNSHRECPGMGQSLAQVGLSVIPGPPPPAPASQYHHPPPSAIIQPQQLAGQRAPQVNGTGGMMQTGFRQTSQGPVSASVMRPYAQQETTA